MDALTTPTAEGFTEDAALAVLGVAPLADLQAKYGMDDDTLDAAVAANETAIAVRAAEIKANGEDIPRAAVGTLRSAVEQLNAQVQSGQLPASTLIRCAELMHKVSGLEAKQRRAEPDDRGRFVFTIQLGNEEKIIVDTHQAEALDEATPDPMAAIREVLKHGD